MEISPEVAILIFNSAMTVLGGVFVFVAGQVGIKFVVEPIYEQSRLIGEIASSLTYYADVGPGYAAEIRKMLAKDSITDEQKKELQQSLEKELDRMREAKLAFRTLASGLFSTTNSVRAYWLFSVFRIVPSYKGILCGSRELIGLSNSVFSERLSAGGYNRVMEIVKCLRIRILQKKYLS